VGPAFRKFPQTTLALSPLLLYPFLSGPFFFVIASFCDLNRHFHYSSWVFPSPFNCFFRLTRGPGLLYLSWGGRVFGGGSHVRSLCPTFLPLFFSAQTFSSFNVWPFRKIPLLVFFTLGELGRDFLGSLSIRVWIVFVVRFFPFAIFLRCGSPSVNSLKL